MLRLVVSSLIVLIFAVAAEHFVGWRSLVYPWLYMDDPLQLALAIGLIGATYVIRTFRLYRHFRFTSGFSACLRLFVQHTFLVNILPMRTGELAFPALMSRYFDIPVQRSLPALLWLRASDLHALLCIPIVLVGITAAPPLSWAALLLAVVWLALPFIVFPFSQALARFAARSDARPYRLLRSALSAIPVTWSELVEHWFLTMANWILKLGVFAWIIHAFSSEDHASSLAGAIGGELASMLPVQGIAGIGTYEGGVVAAMRALGVTTSSALNGAVNLHLFVLGVSIIAALMSLLIRLPDKAAARLPPSAGGKARRGNQALVNRDVLVDDAL